MNEKFKLLPLATLIGMSFTAQAEQVTYSSDLIRSMLPEGQQIDTSYFERGFDGVAGIYDVDVEINGRSSIQRKFYFKEYNGKLEPVVRVSDLHLLNFNEDAISKFKDVDQSIELFPLSNYYSNVSFEFDPSIQKLKVSIPQLFARDDVDGWVDIAPRELWDNGITGAIVNYNLTGNHSRDRHNSSFKRSYINGNLSGHFNFGAWRLHSSGSFSFSKNELNGISNSSHASDIWNTYLQRDVPSINSFIQIGELNTEGRIFDSIPMRGVRIATNEQMIPYRDRYYSPIIEGFANTNAQILIRQNGHVVYTTNVTSGPFKLENLPNFGSFGDLEVVIKEADGTERIMDIPYSSVPMMLKPGQYRYDFNVGRYYRRSAYEGTDNKNFSMATLHYGLSNDISLYGGTLLGEKYFGLAVGSGFSLGEYGAVSMDAIHSRVAQDQDNGIGSDQTGTAWRIRYQKNMNETGTTLNLANYQYLSGDYMSFTDLVEYQTYRWRPSIGGKTKSQWQLSLSQQLGKYGSMSLGTTYTTYKNSMPSYKSYNVGYSTSIQGVGVYLSYMKNYERSYSSEWGSSHSLMLNLEIPFDLFFSGNNYKTLRNHSLSYQGTMNRSVDGNKQYNQQATVRGNTEDYRWNWSLSHTLGNESEDKLTSATIGYDGDFVNADMSIIQSPSTHSFMAGASGAFVLHSGGITPSAPIYNSVALIEVPGVSGVKLSSNFEGKTDLFGNAALPGLKNYSRNEISIDPSYLPDGVMLLDNNSKVLYPTEGAIVKATYPVRFGNHALIYFKHHGTPIPFGANVNLVQDDGTEDPYVRGIIGNNGRVYLTALPNDGTLKVSWKDGAHDIIQLYKYKIVSELNEEKGVEFPKIYLDTESNSAI